jgi:hypothetical protein
MFFVFVRTRDDVVRMWKVDDEDEEGLMIYKLEK